MIQRPYSHTQHLIRKSTQGSECACISQYRNRQSTCGWIGQSGVLDRDGNDESQDALTRVVSYYQDFMNQRSGLAGFIGPKIHQLPLPVAMATPDYKVNSGAPRSQGSARTHLWLSTIPRFCTYAAQQGLRLPPEQDNHGSSFPHL